MAAAGLWWRRVSIAGGVGANTGGAVSVTLPVHDDRDCQLGFFDVSGDMALTTGESASATGAFTVETGTRAGGGAIPERGGWQHRPWRAATVTC